MVKTSYLKKIDIEITQLQMIENAINDLLTLQLNRFSITEENQSKNGHICIHNALMRKEHFLKHRQNN